MLEHTNHTPNLWEIIVGSNLFNVIILAIAFIYLGNRFLPKIMDERKKQITRELENAKTARIKAEKELEVIREKTRKVTLAIEEIKEDARKTSASIKNQIEEETEKEIKALKEKIKKEIISNQEEAIQDIKKQTSETALKLAEKALKELSKNEEVQKKLVSEFLTELKKPSNN